MDIEAYEVAAHYDNRLPPDYSQIHTNSEIDHLEFSDKSKN